MQLLRSTIRTARATLPQLKAQQLVRMPPTRRSSARTAATTTASTAKVEKSTSPAADKNKKRKQDDNKIAGKETSAGGKKSKTTSSAKAAPKPETKVDQEEPESVAKSKAKADQEEPDVPSGPAPKKKGKPTAGGIPESPSAPSVKSDILAYEGSPKNVDIPKDLSHITSSARPENSLRVTSWNIVSLKSSEPKGLTRYLEAENADIVFLSETKVNEIPSFFLSEKYPFQTWGIGTKSKSYAGVALLSKIKPLSVIKGIPDFEEQDTKARCIIAEYSNVYVIGTYCVNAGEGLKTINEKQKWNQALARQLLKLNKDKPIIWTGDLNVVLDERDLSKAATKWNKSAGYTQIECDHHRSFLNGTLDQNGVPPSPPINDTPSSESGDKFLDIWRTLHPTAQGHFSYFGWRGQCRIKGSGWRLDTFITSERIKDQCLGCEIRDEIYGASDHVPVYADFSRSLFE
ncbi:unnamed protein product [Sympodiomycopsis kandeliae]